MQFRQSFATLLLAGTSVLLASCSGGGADSGTGPQVTVASIAISPASASVDVGATTQLVGTPVDASGGAISGRTITWASSNTAQATVSSSGLVTGVAAGGAVTITATSDGRSGTAQITVVEPIASVTVTPGTASITVNGTVSLTATLRDAGGNTIAGGIIAWATTNPSIASVSATGVVTGIAVGGPVTITAASSGRTGTAQINVIVESGLIAAGAFHTCVLGTSGAAKCWGSNLHGQIGDGTQTSRLTAVSVTSGLTFKALAAGNFHSCGLTNSGAAYCWGRNPNGQIGDGSTTNRTTPTAVSGGLTFSSIAAGGDFFSSLEQINAGHTCALSVSGAAYCWGYGLGGQLGDGTRANRTTPTLVSGGLTFTAIFAGSRSTCALTADGTAYCWGSNFNGEIGDGTTTTRPSPVAVAGGLKFRSMAIRSGLTSHSCGVTTGGAGFCWGDSGTGGALGDGTTTSRLTPVAVSGGLSLSSVVAGGTIFGTARSCGLTTAGAAHCWGSNSTSGLGNGTTGSSAVPTPVSGGLSFISLAAYWGHTCGLTAARAVYCWGQNDSGQLGDGTQVARLVPTAVIGVP